jgi:hypothetical protein
MRYHTLFLAGFLFVPLAAQAQPACAPRVPAAKIDAAIAAAQATLPTPGTPVTALLHPGDHLGFALTPERKPAAGSHGGIFAFEAREGGAWRVSINSRAWVDVVQGGKLVASTAHGHPEACGFFTKQVEFTLPPGRTLIQISSNPEPTVAIMVEKTP